MALLSAVFAALFLAAASSARDLRPSDHGLTFQTFSPAGPRSSPEMRSFFNSANSSPSMSSSSDVALPRAMDSGDASPPAWWRPAAGHDGIGKALTVASVVCGAGGAALLVASAFIYLLKHRNRKLKLNAAFCGEKGNRGENDDEDNNKLQLVVRDP
ncbi:uncharacterized protein LOC109800698 [Cajanus cajan]|uniref:Uncharacterized protein n=1 Tax=Cajanus cajan TaxID=3821 RepID=A0A151UC05_CAJCA|nr:uncharacterized protein LOC109800698 [Cajanus cajan]KYP76843.1 hypothetical protein KK1_021104 [Cajanus cajan]